jgi:general secretion pathway protein E
METVIEGKLGRGSGRLHVAPEGLALVEDGGAVVGTARYEEVAGVDAERVRRRGALVVRFVDRADWRLTGLHALQAGFAAELIQDQLAALRRRSLPLFAERQALAQMQPHAQSLLATSQRGAVELLDYLLAQAALHGASDVHLEPFPGVLRVRFRVDGGLQDVLQLPDLWAPRLLARLKIIANLAIYRSDVPQEGRIAVRLPDRTVDVRAALIPTLHGEKAVLRLFDPARTLLRLDQLGMPASVRAAWERLLGSPQGLLLLTGPSNQGKTTTLYASLSHLHEHRRDLSNLCTVEDPVEFDLRVVNQTQVNNAVGLTFAAGLRTVLRQDPEVIMLGEIRDEETAEIALRAGLTGHLILSTVHAPTAAGVFARLVDLGREPFLVASAVSAVLAQRLIRTLCAECRRPQAPGPLQRERLGLGREADGDWSVGAGCSVCNGAGYRGRTGLFGLLEVTEPVRAAVMAGRPSGEIDAAADAAGSLRADALAKARAGLVSLDEVERVLGLGAG